MSTSFTLHQLFTSTETEQFLVPEIQRDYVWGTAQLDKLLSSLRVTFAKQQQTLDLQVSGADATSAIIDSFLEHHRRQRFSQHLGFIYAYHDSSYPGKAFLIDGQQRLLSLYLLLLARAIREEKQADFRMHYLTSTQKVKLDYRVRAVTHDFLQRFVTFVLAASYPTTIPTADAIKQQYWYLSSYAQDPTIAHILDNYTHLEKQVAQGGPTYHFLHHYVKFWYFDTGDSARGEDLYLSLNSTGLLTSTGENQRALLLGAEQVSSRKQYWGSKLEQWQDFFWKHRGESNPNADNGFNEFFRWLRILAPTFAYDTADAAEPIIQALLEVETPRALPPGFTLANADQIMNVLKLLFPKPGSTPIEKTIPAGLLPVRWLAPLGRSVQAKLTTRELFRFLPVLTYCLERAKLPEANRWTQLPRITRYFYNLQRLERVTKADPQDAAKFCSEAILLAKQLGATGTGDITELLAIATTRRVSAALLPEEEKQKLELYCNAGSDRGELELLLSKLEDGPYNSGEVKHFFYKEAIPTTTLPYVRRLYRRYLDLDLTLATNRHLLQSLLLLWGDCTVQDKGSYLYQQYNYGAWSNIIRTKGGGFQVFFSDFLQLEVDLETYYQHNKQQYYTGKSILTILVDKSFDNQLRLLALLFDYFQAQDSSVDKVSLWSKGNQIGYFYPDHAEGRDKAISDDQAAIFGDQTLRFWNVSNRLTSAAHSCRALLPWTYELFNKYNTQGLSYQQFVEARLQEAGAHWAVESDSTIVSTTVI
jgi:hypothetical protein